MGFFADMNVPAQIVGVVAMILLFCSYQSNKRFVILLFQIGISICFITHYALLGAVSGVMINIVCFLRNIVFYFRGRYKWADSIAIPITVCAAELILTVIVWSGPIDLLAIAGALLQTTALWMSKPRNTRIFMAAASPVWIVYDVYFKSYAGIVTEIITLTSLLIAAIRYDFKKKPGEEQADEKKEDTKNSV